MLSFIGNIVQKVAVRPDCYPAHGLSVHTVDWPLLSLSAVFSFSPRSFSRSRRLRFIPTHSTDV